MLSERGYKALEITFIIRSGLGIIAVAMNTLRAALVPGLIAGVISVFGSWLWVGVVFHRFQKETPETWRPEGPRSYAASSLLHVFAAIAIACLYTLMVRFSVGSFPLRTLGSARFGLCIWLALAVPIILQTAIFVRLHRLVVLAELLDWFTTVMASSVVTAWWLAR